MQFYALVQTRSLSIQLRLQIDLITQIAAKFGNQCAVLSVEAKQLSNKGWEVLTENGRERSGRDVIEWVKEATSRGAEIADVW